MKFCAHCGEELTVAVPPGDDRPRRVCSACGEIFYDNPKIVAGCLPRWEDKVLLCRRAIEPRKGYWTLPAGYMETSETLEEGAIRETHEEANAEVSIVRLQSIVSLPFIDQVYFLFLADLKHTNFSPGAESSDVRLFTEDEIPWPELAFRAVEFSLERFFTTRDTDSDAVHSTSFSQLPTGAWTRTDTPKQE